MGGDTGAVLVRPIAEATTLAGCTLTSAEDSRSRRPPLEGAAVTIDRRVRGPRDAEMIRIAEETLPARASVRAAWREPFLEEDAVRLWWHESLGGVLIPFAITSDAVFFYQQRLSGIASARSGDGPTSISTMHYSACVTYHPVYHRDGREFNQVFAVNLELKVHEFGPGGGYKFQKERLVLIDEQAQVQAVFGDGRTAVIRLF